MILSIQCKLLNVQQFSGVALCDFEIKVATNSLYGVHSRGYLMS